MSELVQRAKQIIFSMEGNYGSVNMNDNGALSVGCCQWHGDRAKALLYKMINADPIKSMTYLDAKLRVEIIKSGSWKNRVVESIKEKNDLSAFLNSTIGRQIQNLQAENDIQSYVNHITALGIKDEETIIFLADIQNQGGSGASSRIELNAISKYGKDVTLEQVVDVALNDVVFKKYQARRLNVYKKLVNRDYHSTVNPIPPKPVETPLTYHIVKSRDNLTKIAEKYGTTVARIVKDNNIQDKNIIIVGQKLKITKDGIK